MKLVILLVSALAATCTFALPPPPNPQLILELKDFILLLPKIQMTFVFQEYLAVDAEVQSCVNFLSSDLSKQYLLDLEAIKEYQKLLGVFVSAGIDAYSYMAYLHLVLGLPPYVTPTTYGLRKTGVGMKGLLKDLEKLLPTKAIAIMGSVKLFQGGQYKTLYNIKNSDAYKNAYCATNATEEFQTVLESGKKYGFDLQQIEDFALKIFNLYVPEVC